MATLYLLNPLLSVRCDVACYSLSRLLHCFPAKNSDDECEEFIDTLLKLYFKKLNEHKFSPEDLIFLDKASDKKSSIQEKTFGIASDLLKKDKLNDQEEMMLKLSLSSIVNILQPDMYDFYRTVSTKKEMKLIENADEDTYVGLSEQDEELLNKIIKSDEGTVDISNIMNEISTEQLRLNKQHQENSDTYKVLNILRCMIENAQNSYETDSENTAYRHCAQMLDYLFSGTKLKLLDGEPGCLSVKEDMISNHSLYPDTAFSSNTLSTCTIRKIDAIIITEISKDRVELSNNEWKKPGTRSTTAIKQQSKNLRSNLSILNQLKHKYQIQTNSIFAMDFIGYSGYMYNLFEKESVYVPHLIEELILPTELAEIKHVAKTINALFMLKNHTLKLSAEVADKLQAKSTKSKLKGIIRSKEQNTTSSYRIPRVAFSVNTKKRKTPL